MNTGEMLLTLVKFTVKSRFFILFDFSTFQAIFFSLVTALCSYWSGKELYLCNCIISERWPRGVDCIYEGSLEHKKIEVMMKYAKQLLPDLKKEEKNRIRRSAVASSDQLVNRDIIG